MSRQITIPARERGVVRVFALSMDDADARALKDDPEQLARILGVSEMFDGAHIELFPVSDLEGVGLAGFLVEGAGVAETQIAPDRLKLDKLGGWVLILFSLAFRDAATVLEPASSLTLIGTYGETRTDWRAPEPLASASANPYSAPQATVRKKPSDAAMSGRIAMLVLLVLGLLTYAMIWIGG